MFTFETVLDIKLDNTLITKYNLNGNLELGLEVTYFHNREEGYLEIKELIPYNLNIDNETDIDLTLEVNKELAKELKNLVIDKPELGTLLWEDYEKRY